MKLLIEKTEHMNGVYIEPFAGGAGIAFDCLLNEVVSEIVINDLDKGIYSFWRAILEETDRFINDVMNVPLNINEWEKQRQIYLMNNQKYSYELGFSTFYLNRTNRSGIIKGGVIGGKNRLGSGHWVPDSTEEHWPLEFMMWLCAKIEYIYITRILVAFFRIMYQSMRGML